MDQGTDMLDHFFPTDSDFNPFNIYETYDLYPQDTHQILGQNAQDMHGFVTVDDNATLRRSNSERNNLNFILNNNVKEKDESVDSDATNKVRVNRRGAKRGLERMDVYGRAGPIRHNNNGRNSFSSVSSPVNMMGKLENDISRINWHIEKIRGDLRNILVLPVEENDQREIKDCFSDVELFLESARECVYSMENECTLTAVYLYRLDCFKLDLDRLRILVDLYYSEFIYMCNNQAYEDCFAYLMVYDKPGPIPIKKQQRKKRITISVLLLSGVHTQFSQIGPVKGFLKKDDGTTITNYTTLANEVAPLVNYLAVFKNLEFNRGSHLKTVSLDFELEVCANYSTGLTENRIIRTYANNEFETIVMTNAKQWQIAQKTLLMRSLFENGTNEVSRNYFFNYIHRYFLTTFEMDRSNPKRSFQQNEFKFFQTIIKSKENERSGSRNTISKNDFLEFWKWFGPVVRLLKGRISLLKMWEDGLIFGFISKEEICNRLEYFSVGTFGLRFSVNAPGSLAVTYKWTPTEYRHYLLKKGELDRNCLVSFLKYVLLLLLFVVVLFMY
eukprot:TRINITY_DN3357_c0_g1_i1.p1 TRINITY_DN3357_c0_g1~~TRINITY_DN3357_c0_g1_i1.p1  ORF type:complete len:570 (-),score=93.89 TRINITY_DN3357_c0_g1_i1:215-1885(-)